LLRRRWVDRALALRLVLPPLALALPWLAQGYLASGCPFFPSTVGCVPFEWATPATIADDAYAWIQSWARAPWKMHADVLGSWQWLPGWARSMVSSQSIQVLVVLLAASAVLLVVLRAHRLRGTVTLLWGVALAGVLFWFAMAPDPRFVWGFLFALALVPAAEASAVLLARWPGRTSASLLAASLLLAATWIGTESLSWVRREPAKAFRLTTWPRIPAGKFQARQTLTGVHLFVPVGTVQCWLAPLPCTPYFDPGLVWDGTWRTTTVGRGQGGVRP
jgi:hypothetical protein